jgi:hypothetical protein
MYSEKTNDLAQGIDKFYCIKLYRVHLAIWRIRINKFSDDRQLIPKVVFS